MKPTMGLLTVLQALASFVEIENTIEGMVRVDYLNDDYYDYEASKYRFDRQKNQ